MTPRFRLAAALLALLAAAVTPAAACGPDTDCTPGERTDRTAIAPGQGPFGAIVSMHDWRASAAAVVRDEGLRRTVREPGVALIARESGGEGWLIANRPESGLRHDLRETDHSAALLDDAIAPSPVGGPRVLATGFSSGGMTTRTLACRMPGRFAAFLPVAGTFWAPVPDDCVEADRDLLHVRSSADGVAPLGGRANADARQGNVLEALATVRGERDGVAEAAGPPGLACEGARSAAGRIVLCLHDGGHVVRPRWLARRWRNMAETVR